jgi:hypothetical protein
MATRGSGIVVSGVLHAVIIAATSFLWVPTLELPEDEHEIVPIELVSSIAAETNIAPTVQKNMPPPVIKPLAEVPRTDVDLAPPPPPEPVEVEAPPPEPEAPAPPPPPVAEAPPPPPPPPPPPQVAEAPPPPTPAPLRNLPAPRRKPAPPQKPNFNIDDVVKLLDKRDTKPPAAPPPPNARLAENTQKGIGAQNALTVDIKDALLSQMRACWNVPVGAPNPEQLIVQVRVFLSQDGKLARPPQLEPATRTAMATNAYLRTAAEAALRAVNICEPYQHLPAEKYEAWREIVMTFDPSKMVR